MHVSSLGGISMVRISFSSLGSMNRMKDTCYASSGVNKVKDMHYQLSWCEWGKNISSLGGNRREKETC